MTRTPFDQFCKRLLKELLSPLGEVQLNLEVPGEPRSADVWFTPFSQPAVDQTSLGLLAVLVRFMPLLLRTAIVVLNDLPPIPETLWLRLLGRGATQRQAIQEVLALPRDHPQRAIALRLLVGWKITIEVSGEIDEEDQEVVMTLAEVYQELLEREQEAERRGIERGVERGVERGAKTLVIRQLNRQVGELPESIRTQIDTLSLPQLEALGEALLDFANLSDLEVWLAAQG